MQNKTYCGGRWKLFSSWSVININELFDFHNFWGIIHWCCFSQGKEFTKQQGISFWIENKIISAYERSTEKSRTIAVLWSPIMYMYPNFWKTFLKKAQNIPSGENFYRRLAVLVGLIVKLRPWANFLWGVNRPPCKVSAVAISVLEWSCSAPILKVDCHILDEFLAVFVPV